MLGKREQNLTLHNVHYRRRGEGCGEVAGWQVCWRASVHVFIALKAWAETHIEDVEAAQAAYDGSET